MRAVFIAEQNALEIAGESGYVLLKQAAWPNGEPWASEEQALEWGNLFIEQSLNHESEFIAGHSPEEPKLPRPIDEPPVIEEPEVLTIDPPAPEEAPSA